MLQRWYNKIRSVRRQRVVIIGQGYVGLPLAMRAAKVGYDVVGYDTDEEKIQRLKSAASPIDDVSDKDIAAALSSGRYLPSSNPADMDSFNVAVITVPTPLRDNRPDTSFIELAGKSLAPHLRRGALVILESTSYPGTVEELLAPILESGSGLVRSRDFYLGFSPERIDPSNTTWTLELTPKLISGIDEASLTAIENFYRPIVKTLIPVSGTREAEFAKLLENTYRHVNIALVNELAVHAHNLGIDIWEVIRAASTKPFGFSPFHPGPGVGGHCLPIDPEYLSWKFEQHSGDNSDFIKLASVVNRGMPEYVVTRLVEGLRSRGKEISQARILIIGLSYKKNSSDLRESPAVEVLEKLVNHGATITAVDPFVQGHRLASIEVSQQLDLSQVRDSDAVLVLTDHDGIDYDGIVSMASYVFDVRHRVRGSNVEYL